MWEILGSHLEKLKLDTYFTLNARINFKWIRDLTVKKLEIYTSWKKIHVISFL